MRDKITFGCIRRFLKTTTQKEKTEDLAPKRVWGKKKKKNGLWGGRVVGAIGGVRSLVG